jgi:class 3 adenylate cyclase
MAASASRQPLGNALAEHRRLPRAAFAKHRECEVDTEGDGFFVAFPRASGSAPADSCKDRP